MPHIKFAERENVCKFTVGSWLQGLESAESGSVWDRAGTIAYVTYCAMRGLSCGRVGGGGGWRPMRWAYTALAIGAVLCAILEFYRLDVAVYEDEKIKDHGAA